MLEWIIENKEWVFSGIGIFILTIIMGLIKWFFSKKKSDRTINMTGEKSVYVEKNKGKIDIK
jgi:hypothetical protein